tara:strand:- start:1185 stop:1355 length:171 start_codon:yes stop_codon:yes gene_type:complete
LNEYCSICGKENDTFTQSCTKCFKKMGKDAPHTRRCVDLNDSSCYEMPCICEEAEN